MKNTKIYSIIYSPEQIGEYTQYFNKIKTIKEFSYLFEINPIVDIVDNHTITEDYLGIFSYKFPQKTGIFKKKLYWLLNKHPDFEVYGLCFQHLKGKYLSFTEKVHPGFLNIFVPLCKDLGLEVKEPKYVLYSNYFIAKTEIYKRFVEEIVKPTIVLLDIKYKEQVFKDSTYKGLDSKILKEQTGLDYYTFHPFIFERLAAIYLNKFNFKQLI
jgi:hypothetical protein